MIMTKQDYAEIDAMYAEIFDMAMEGTTISEKQRRNLPDDCFGLIEEHEDGTAKRSYPLIVPDDKKLTHELITKAVQFFHYCKPNQKAELANNIVRAISETGTEIEISEASQILRYVNKDELPTCVTIVPKKGRK